MAELFQPGCLKRRPAAFRLEEVPPAAYSNIEPAALDE